MKTQIKSGDQTITISKTHVLLRGAEWIVGKINERNKTLGLRKPGASDERLKWAKISDVEIVNPDGAPVYPSKEGALLADDEKRGRSIGKSVFDGLRALDFDDSDFDLVEKKLRAKVAHFDVELRLARAKLDGFVAARKDQDVAHGAAK